MYYLHFIILVEILNVSRHFKKIDTSVFIKFETIIIKRREHFKTHMQYIKWARCNVAGRA